ncbi:MAG: hypothetical protein ABSG04_07735 [Verrucomicrobiota bacterium]
MRKRPRNLSLEPPAPVRLIAFTPPGRGDFTGLLKLRRDPAGEPRKIPVKHLPSPRSPILLKVVATETYSGNTPRLQRRRQFCDRFRPS